MSKELEMNNKEQWADEVLQSLDGIQKAKPNPELFAKITNKLYAEKQSKIIPLKQLGWVAAAACLLLALNIYTFDLRIKSEENTIDETVAENKIIHEFALYK